MINYHFLSHTSICSPLGHNATVSIVLIQTYSHLPKNLPKLINSQSIINESKPFRSLFKILFLSGITQACKYRMEAPRHIIENCLLLLLWWNFCLSSLVHMFELCFHLKDLYVRKVPVSHLIHYPKKERERERERESKKRRENKN